jgi:hypothetical protein
VENSHQPALERQSSRDVLIEGLSDWVDLGFARQYVKDEVGDITVSELREQTIEVIGALLDAGLFVAGDLSQAGFATWPLGSAEALARIRDEWAAPDAPLRPGDVCWLQITEEGQLLAQRLVETDR